MPRTLIRFIALLLVQALIVNEAGAMLSARAQRPAPPVHSGCLFTEEALSNRLDAGFAGFWQAYHLRRLAGLFVGTLAMPAVLLAAGGSQAISPTLAPQISLLAAVAFSVGGPVLLKPWFRKWPFLYGIAYLSAASVFFDLHFGMQTPTVLATFVTASLFVIAWRAMALKMVSPRHIGGRVSTRRQFLEWAGLLGLLSAAWVALAYPFSWAWAQLKTSGKENPTKGTPTEAAAFSPMRYPQYAPTPPGEKILGVQVLQTGSNLSEVQPSDTIYSLRPLEASILKDLNEVHQFTGELNPKLIAAAGTVDPQASILLDQDPTEGVDNQIVKRLSDYRAIKDEREQFIKDLQGAQSPQPEIFRMELLKMARDIDLLLLRRSMYKLPVVQPIDVVPNEGLLGNPASDVELGATSLHVADHLQKDEAELNVIIAPKDIAEIMHLWKAGNPDATIVLARHTSDEAADPNHVPKVLISDILDILDPDEAPADQISSKETTNEALTASASRRSRPFRIRVRWKENYPPDQTGPLTYRGYTPGQEPLQYADNHVFIASAELAGGPAELPHRWEIDLLKKQIEHLQAESRDLAHVAAHIRELADLAQATGQFVGLDKKYNAQAKSILSTIKPLEDKIKTLEEKGTAIDSASGILRTSAGLYFATHPGKFRTYAFGRPWKVSDPKDPSQEIRLAQPDSNGKIKIRLTLRLPSEQLPKKRGEKLKITLPELPKESRDIEIENIPQNLPSDVYWKVSRFKAEISLTLNEWLSLFPAGASPARLMLTVKLTNPAAPTPGQKQKSSSKAPQGKGHASLKRPLVIAGVAAIFLLAFMVMPDLPAAWCAGPNTPSGPGGLSPAMRIGLYAVISVAVVILGLSIFNWIRESRQATPPHSASSTPSIAEIPDSPVSSPSVNWMLTSLEAAIEAKRDEEPDRPPTHDFPLMGRGDIAPDLVAGFQRELERLGQFQAGWPQNTSLDQMCDSLNIAINHLTPDQLTLIAKRLGIDTTAKPMPDIAIETFTILTHYLRHDVRLLSMRPTASRHHFPIALPAQTTTNPDFNFVSCALTAGELRIYSPDLLQRLLESNNSMAWLETVLYWQQFHTRYPPSTYPHLTLLGQNELVDDNPDLTVATKVSSDQFKQWQDAFVAFWDSIDSGQENLGQVIQTMVAEDRALGLSPHLAHLGRPFDAPDLQRDALKKLNDIHEKRLVEIESDWHAGDDESVLTPWHWIRVHFLDQPIRLRKTPAMLLWEIYQFGYHSTDLSKWSARFMNMDYLTSNKAREDAKDKTKHMSTVTFWLLTALFAAIVATLVGSNVFQEAFTSVFEGFTHSGLNAQVNLENPLISPIFYFTFFGTFVLTAALRTSEFWWSLKLQIRKFILRVIGFVRRLRGKGSLQDLFTEVTDGAEKYEEVLALLHSPTPLRLADRPYREDFLEYLDRFGRMATRTLWNLAREKREQTGVPSAFEINLMNRVREAARAPLDPKLARLVEDPLEFPYPEELNRRLADKGIRLSDDADEQFEQRLIAEVTAAETAMLKSPRHALYIIVETDWLGARLAKDIEPSVKLEDEIKDLVNTMERRSKTMAPNSFVENRKSSRLMEPFALMEFIWELEGEKSTHPLLGAVCRSLLDSAVNVTDQLEGALFSRMLLEDPHAPQRMNRSSELARLVDRFTQNIALKGEYIFVWARRKFKNDLLGARQLLKRRGLSNPFKFLSRKYMYRIELGGQIVATTDGISLLTIQNVGNSLLKFVVEHNHGAPPLGRTPIVLDPALFSNLSAPIDELKLYTEFTQGDIWIVSSGSVLDSHVEELLKRVEKRHPEVYARIHHVRGNDLEKEGLRGIYETGSMPIIISSVEVENWSVLSRIRGIRIQQPVPYVTSAVLAGLSKYIMDNHARERGQKTFMEFMDTLDIPAKTDWERRQILEERKQQFLDLQRLLHHFNIETRLPKDWPDFAAHTLMNRNDHVLLVPASLGAPPEKTFLVPAAITPHKYFWRANDTKRSG